MKSPRDLSVTVLMRCKYMHDGFLWKVLCKFHDQFVVWDFNDQTAGVSSGHYHELLGRGVVEFLQQVEFSNLLHMNHIQHRLGCDHWEFVEPCATHSSLVGHVDADLSAEQLTIIFGKPWHVMEKDEKGKTDIEWEGLVDGYHFRIYNYKDGKAWLGEDGKSIDELRDWNIGGASAAYIPHLVNHKISEALILHGRR